MTSPPVLERRRVHVRGVVQGVGFRPFVHALAGELGLTGRVRNDADGVRAEVEGSPAALAAFCDRLRTQAPPLADVEDVTWQPLPPTGEPGFRIDGSDLAAAGRPDAAGRTGAPGRTGTPPDVGTCPQCLAELADPGDRRYRHPFISCTSCGPRYTIITALPYDRPRTTMAGFPLCPDCAREYADPGDRRFHAQPVACHRCGPVLELVGPGRRPATGPDALAAARAALGAGAVVAVKGLGGYHLACDATDPVAVARLRRRKRRGGKPFAVLVADVATARQVCAVDPVEEASLAGPRRPVVLLRRREAPADGAPRIAAEVAPGSPDLGLLLPPTALHQLLLGPGPDGGPLPALVLTSGNLSGEPIVTDDAQALDRLADLADLWLRHDRPIHVPCDDSVVRVVAGRELLLRRSRGYAPLPVALPFPVPPLLAAGGDLKSVPAVAAGGRAWLSGHVGDLDDLATQQVYDTVTTHLAALTDVTPTLLAADLHPGYRSTRWAERAARTLPGAPLPLVRVQHHHAHVAAVMAEHALAGPVIGIALDGTGYGTDATVWGGEVLLAGYTGFRRFAHLSTVPLPGGDAAVRRPYRMALAHLDAAGVPWADGLPCVRACPPQERAVLARQLRTGAGCVATSSTGRLFDAVAAVAGLCQEIAFEAEAAAALEAAALRWGPLPAGSGYPLPLRAGAAAGGPRLIDVGAAVRAVAHDVGRGAPAGHVAAAFHRGLADALVAAAVAARQACGLTTVVLAGGVLANTVLLQALLAGLDAAGLTACWPRLVPPGDGGLALGQAAVAGTVAALPSPTRSPSRSPSQSRKQG